MVYQPPRLRRNRSAPRSRKGTLATAAVFICGWLLRNVYKARELLNMDETIESLIAYCREKKRICPSPSQWNQLWKMLPNGSTGRQPPLPLILAAWYDTPAILKTLRLEEHIRWAAQHGALETVGKFLRELREADWFHIGE